MMSEPPWKIAEPLLRQNGAMSSPAEPDRLQSRKGSKMKRPRAAEAGEAVRIDTFTKVIVASFGPGKTANIRIVTGPIGSPRLKRIEVGWREAAQAIDRSSDRSRSKTRHLRNVMNR
jgi:hypothetical protein